MNDIGRLFYNKYEVVDARSSNPFDYKTLCILYNFCWKHQKVLINLIMRLYALFIILYNLMMLGNSNATVII